MSKKGLIILGHGSKAPEATETLAAVTRMVAEKASYDGVAYASLQISEPGLGKVVEEYVQKGFTRLDVLPFLIAMGQHVKVDIPKELAELKEQHPGLIFKLGRPLGADPRLAEILLDRIKELGA